MTIPIIRDKEVARRSVLRRVPLDEVTISPAMQEEIAARFGEPLTPSQAVDRILRDVRTRGDAALRDWTQQLDQTTITTLEIPPARLEAAAASIPPDLRDAMRVAIEELKQFHLHQVRHSWVDFGREGVVGQIVTPLTRVGIYVPGGSAPLPSSLLHAAIPAQVAGVEEIIVCAPPQRGRTEPSEVVLAAAHLAGVHRLFCVGGAQAIGAMAYGTESVPRVDKIVGPGNLFVVLAKRAVFGSVGIESLPGPTETLVIADDQAHARSVAADLLAQAEHRMASAILLTTSESLALAVQQELVQQLAQLPEEHARGATEAVEQRGGIIIVPDLETAIELANEYAPEHLCLLIADPWAIIGQIRNAGGIFVGEHSFEVLGDYTAGPSHIMPTGGTARYASPVNVDDFRKIISLVGKNPGALRRIGPAAMRLAEAEGLLAHAAAVRARLEPR